jgi:hypothetical protein
VTLARTWMMTRPSSNSVATSKLDRAVSVAPMMDWTDEDNRAFKINNIELSDILCLLYVSSNFGALVGLSQY